MDLLGGPHTPRPGQGGCYFHNKVGKCERNTCYDEDR